VNPKINKRTIEINAPLNFLPPSRDYVLNLRLDRSSIPLLILQLYF